jgi:hypothetical protein
MPQLTPKEIAKSLSVLNDFVANFPVDEDGEDLSTATNASGEIERQDFAANVGKLRRLFG